jgi:site-specific recombinase XerC
MGLMAANPCEAIERPKTVPSQPRGMTAEDIRKLLAVIPDTPTGVRDRAIVLTLTFTGRRRAEVMSLTAGSIVRDGETVFYEYRGKGGKTGKRELPRPAYEAIVSALAAWGKDLATMTPGESLWPSTGSDRGLTSGTFYGNLRR